MIIPPTGSPPCLADAAFRVEPLLRLSLKLIEPF